MNSCFTVAAGPETAPHNVTVNRLNGTTMNVSWVPLNLVEARGFIQIYVITYEPASGGNRRKRQLQEAQADASASSSIVGGLRPGVPYDVTVSGQTVARGQSEFIGLVIYMYVKFVLFSLKITVS